MKTMFFILLSLCTCHAFGQVEVYNLYERDDRYEAKDICNLYRQYDQYILYSEYKMRLTTADFGLIGPVKSVSEHPWIPEPTQVNFDKYGRVSQISIFWGWNSDALMHKDICQWKDDGRFEEITTHIFNTREVLCCIIRNIPQYNDAGQISGLDYFLEYQRSDTQDYYPLQADDNGKIGTVAYTYNDYGMVTEIANTMATGSTAHVTFIRDAGGRIIREESVVSDNSYRANRNIEYRYDDNGRLSVITYLQPATNLPTMTLEYAYEYNPDGAISEQHVKRYDYNDDGQKEYLYTDSTEYQYDEYMNVKQYRCVGVSDNPIRIMYY